MGSGKRTMPTAQRRHDRPRHPLPPPAPTHPTRITQTVRWHDAGGCERATVAQQVPIAHPASSAYPDAPTPAREDRWMPEAPSNVVAARDATASFLDEDLSKPENRINVALFGAQAMPEFWGRCRVHLGLSCGSVPPRTPSLANRTKSLRRRSASGPHADPHPRRSPGPPAGRAPRGALSRRPGPRRSAAPLDGGREVLPHGTWRAWIAP